ncbi:MAG: Transcriptional activator of fatty acid utilization [Watsoniomyces obsoletus]|nr:MAG: Transcriptional activator of fatty acid utilization [Watsoniomyces obsoletus]
MASASLEATVPPAASEPANGGGSPASNEASSAAAASGAATAPNSQRPGHPSFRRQRASRACETCHARKVRCDAASLGVPCTNCVAFSIECRIPPPKRKKAQTRSKDSDSEHGELGQEASPAKGSPRTQSSIPNTTPQQASKQGTPPTNLSEAQAAQQTTDNATWTEFMKPKFARAPIKEAGRVAYLGESSNLSLLVQDRYGTTDVVHYPLPDTVKGSRARLTELDHVEIDILTQRGAFLLPHRALCDDLVDAYFRWVAPVVPVINRSRFMRKYRDLKNPPSLLLLQAVLLAGSRVCNNPRLMDINGSTTPAAMTFYKRAKALYDANYEDDRVTIVQALILMGWYWEGPEDVTKNVFYWSRVAIVVAQGSGMHRSVEGSQLSRADKRLWKRIWWTLFTRDRSVAVALGRPVHINTDDSDVEMIAEDDFIEDEEDQPADYAPDPLHVRFFLQYVKLCDIMGLVLSQQYSVASKVRRQTAIALAHSDMALADWLQNCPREICWEPSRHYFWSALLHANYYTTLCLLHRAHMPPATAPAAHHPNGSEEAAYPSRHIAFQAAAMITSIVEHLSNHDELRYCPAFIVYSLFSALIMHVYQMRSSIPSVVYTAQQRINVCMNALKEVSKVWLVAKMVHTLFEYILGNKILEDKLQKAAGERHSRLPKAPVSAGQRREEPLKRKFGEMDLGFTNGPPAPQVSYERSRPQTPAPIVSRDLGHAPGTSTSMPAPAPPTSSPGMRPPNDTLMGGLNSRSITRPPTPFNPSFSIPGSPPDLFLVTRNSPQISQSVWENFQPDRLFPESSSNMPLASSSYGMPNLDPQLTQPMPPLETTAPGGIQSSPSLGQMSTGSLHHQQQRPLGAGTQGLGSPLGGGIPGPSTTQPMIGTTTNLWPEQYEGMDMTGNSPDETGSNGSRGPIVPATLNMEDW